MRFPTSAYLLVLAIWVLATPAACAQGQPRLLITVELEHGRMQLNDNGRHMMPLQVQLTAENFTCPQPLRVAASLALEYENKWAGASLEPPEARWTLGTLEPGALGRASRHSETVLDIAWDLEGAPRHHARQNYTVVPKDVKMETLGSCVPPPGSVHVRRGPPMEAWLPDRAEPGADGPLACHDPEDWDVCGMPDVIEDPPERPRLPGLAGFLTLLPVAAAAWAGRGRRA